MGRLFNEFKITGEMIGLNLSKVVIGRMKVIRRRKYCIVSLLAAHGGAKSYEYKFSFLASIEQQTNRK